MFWHSPRIKLALLLLLINCLCSCGPIGNVEIIGIEVEYPKYDIPEGKLMEYRNSGMIRITGKALDSIRTSFLSDRVDCIYRHSEVVNINCITKYSGEHRGGCYERNPTNDLIKESLEIYIYSDNNKKMDMSDKFSHENWYFTFDENTINNAFIKSTDIHISIMTTNGNLLESQFRFCDL